MISVACKGCGVCAATCYKSAIGMSHYTDEQLDAQVKAYLRGDESAAIRRSDDKHDREKHERV
jgi:ferredoxin